MRRRPGTFCAAANAALHWALGQILFRQTDRQSDQRHDDGCKRDRRLSPRSPPPPHEIPHCLTKSHTAKSQKYFPLLGNVGFHEGGVNEDLSLRFRLHPSSRKEINVLLLVSQSRR